jgi:glycosyltransferase involved in cell wall biosynthesis
MTEYRVCNMDKKEVQSDERQLLLRSKSPLSTSTGGGAASLMRSLAQVLTDIGWRVDTITPLPKNLPDEQMQFNQIWFDYFEPENQFERILDSVRGSKKLRDVIVKGNYNCVVDDVSHLPFFPMHFCGVNNYLFLHTLLLADHFKFSSVPESLFVNFIERTLPKLGSPQIICAGPSTKSRLVEELNYQKTSVIRPFIDTKTYSYNPMPNSSIILYLGRLTKRKNVGLLLDAWAKKDREYKLIIAGSGPQEEYLKNKRSRLNLNNVVFEGYVSESRKYELLEKSKYMVIPSYIEGYVTTGLEALASGTPVIGSDTVGINDYIKNKENGFLFACDDSASLIDVLEQALTFDEHSVLAEEGRRTAEKHTKEVFYQQVVDVFE